ncbi:MAG TPA: TadE/TadG family type IV pilus assembly protein [Alphaproteobacteria bacterium]|nr:TadE/TadG family type IV pilus assembly protein [Alphaproteobacteria bacterium]
MYQWIKEKIGKIDKGVAAIEFAIILPFMLLTLIGLFDISEFIFANNKMNRTAQNISSIVTRGPVTKPQLDAMLQAAVLVAQPFNFTQSGNVIVTCVGVPTTPANAPPQVMWRDSYPGGTGGSKISASGLPGGLVLSVGQSAIFTEVFFTYTPLVPGYVLSSSQTEIYALAAAVPRQGNMMTLPAS